MLEKFITIFILKYKIICFYTLQRQLIFYFETEELLERIPILLPIANSRVMTEKLEHITSNKYIKNKNKKPNSLGLLCKKLLIFFLPTIDWSSQIAYGSSRHVIKYIIQNFNQTKKNDTCLMTLHAIDTSFDYT